MCGIAGIVDFTRPAAAHRERLARMQTLLRHRGPDGAGTFEDDDVSLAHTRLAILDLDGGVQPMTSENGRYTVVYNGELHGGEELRRAIGGDFRTHSDTEVVLAAFERWGDACVARLSGMFAFFVWDAVRRRGFGARDRLGVKPLFISRENHAFAFASEAHVLAHTAAARPRANVDAIVDVMVAPCFSGVVRSAFEGVEPLMPGHTVVVERDHVRVARYWRWSAERGDGSIAELREALPAAMRRATAADVPIGIFSSGGLDSAIAASALAAGAPAFTVTFDDQASFHYARSRITGSDDTPFARDVAEALSLDPHLVHVSRAQIAHDLRAVAVANDALPAWEQEIAQHRLAQAASRSVKAVLVGDAADETHWGYHFLLDDEAIRSSRVIIDRLGSAPLRPEIARDPAERIAHELDAEYAHESRIAATTSLIVERWLPRLLHNGDMHTMRASLEARVPFADVTLLEIAQRIAPALALRDGVEKHALREAARGLIPEHVRTRKKSALPKDLGTEPVFRAEAAKVVRDPPAIVDSIVDLARIAARLGDPSELSEAERAILFRVVTFAHWARHHEVPAP